MKEKREIKDASMDNIFDVLSGEVNDDTVLASKQDAKNPITKEDAREQDIEIPISQEAKRESEQDTKIPRNKETKTPRQKALLKERASSKSSRCVTRRGETYYPTNVMMRLELHKALKIAAIEDGVSEYEILNSALSMYFKKRLKDSQQKG